MKEIARLLNEMLDAGIITDYALFGALAQIRYTEPVATLDADVLVGVPLPDKNGCTRVRLLRDEGLFARE